MRPLKRGLEKYNEHVKNRFHMPGHKGKQLYKISEIYKLDVTEVEGTDNLHNPKNIIKDSQDYVCSVYGAKKTFYCINGSTAGIYASILSVTNPNDKILVQRNCHISVYNAMILGKLKPTYIYPELDEENQIVGNINLEVLSSKLKRDKEIKAVIITNPSYYGVCNDILEVVKIVHNYGRILIVDEAHGAHLKFHKKLPLSSIDAGADIVVQSTHKTLPALTQTSLVHVCSDRVDINKLKKMLKIYQTTSPSYLLMTSIEESVEYMDEHGNEKLEKLLLSIEKVKKDIKKIKGVEIFDKKKSNKIYDFDNTKLLISLIDLGITGTELEAILNKDYALQVEMSDTNYILAMITVSDNICDLLALKNAIQDIAKNKAKHNNNLKPIYLQNKKSEICVTPYEAFYTDSESIKIEDSEGRISADFIVPYPPGIPILCPGEKINQEIIKDLNKLYRHNIQILGVDEEGLQVKVLK
ncbi:aminotransferase class I/II-fold pyridoxal phosphate-dependent enzyme [Clostridiaceae bacterium M8S5]|nr:aminotransferase class I/II-fold pyridoxal phosphate-dependent enzyme [Clostridiaceae bacterium M8S5]